MNAVNATILAAVLAAIMIIVGVIVKSLCWKKNTHSLSNNQATGDYPRIQLESVMLKRQPEFTHKGDYFRKSNKPNKEYVYRAIVDGVKYYGRGSNEIHARREAAEAARNAVESSRKARSQEQEDQPSTSTYPHIPAREAYSTIQSEPDSIVELQAISHRQEDENGPITELDRRSTDGPISELDRRSTDVQYFVVSNNAVGPFYSIGAFVRVDGNSFYGEGLDENSAKQAAAREALRQIEAPDLVALLQSKCPKVQFFTTTCSNEDVLNVFVTVQSHCFQGEGQRESQARSRAAQAALQGLYGWRNPRIAHNIRSSPPPAYDDVVNMGTEMPLNTFQ